VSLRLLSVADLNADPAACTLLSNGISPAPVFPTEKPAPVLVASAERAQHVVVTLDMQLRELRWGDPFHPATPEELAAIAGKLIRATIGTRLMERSRGSR